MNDETESQKTYEAGEKQKELVEVDPELLLHVQKVKERVEKREKILRAFHSICVEDIPSITYGDIKKINDGDYFDKSYIIGTLKSVSISILEDNYFSEYFGEDVRQFIGNALWRIGNGEDANVAFRLKSKQKRKADMTVEAKIAMRVMFAIEIQSMTVDGAFEVVGDAENKSPDQIRKIYYKHNKRLREEMGIS